MMAGPGVDPDAGGGPARHVPVLLAEVLYALAPQPGEVIVDGTFGAGGYAKAILAQGAAVVAIDRDPDAVAVGRAVEAAAQSRLKLVEGRFSELDRHVERADGVVLDLGVSSMQFDEADRGFSLRFDGPLDMRMGQAGPSAADIVNGFKPEDLVRIFGLLGEERHAGRIARMVARRREERPFTRTLDLAESIASLVGRRHDDKIHPATRVFQALRIFVNDELGELARGLLAAERALGPGGRLVVVSFHSLEDRLVKRFIADRSEASKGSRHMPEPAAAALTFRKDGGAVPPGEAELRMNPRSRSARLRAAVRTSAPPRGGELDQFGLPKLPALSTSGRTA